MKSSLTFILLFVYSSTWIGADNMPNGIVTTYYTVSATIYNPESNQCDLSPLRTADGSKINVKKANKLRWIAVSRDLLKIFKYGDTTHVVNNPELNGYWIIHDCMNKRFKNKIDFLQNRKGFYGSWNGIIIKKDSIVKFQKLSRCK